MPARVVIVRVGVYMVSLPFEHIDEILGSDRVESVDNLPEDAARAAVEEDGGERSWVYSRGRWLPVGELLPDTSAPLKSQIVVVRWGEAGRAFAVDQVLSIETPGKMAPFPARARPYTDVPVAGVWFWDDGPVLELDLSRLISLNSGD